MVRMVKLSRKGQIVVPADVRRELDVGPGDRLVIMLRAGEAVLVTPAEYARRTRGLLEGTWGRTEEEVDAYLQGERSSWR